MECMSFGAMNETQYSMPVRSKDKVNSVKDNRCTTRENGSTGKISILYQHCVLVSYNTASLANNIQSVNIH